MGWTVILEFAKYCVPLAGGIIVWFLKRKKNFQLNKLMLLEKSKSLIPEDRYKYLEGKVSNEVLATEIKIRNDEYFEFGVFLIKNKILNGTQYKTLKNYLVVKNKKVKFNVGCTYCVDFAFSRVMIFLFLALMSLYVYISVVAFDSLVGDISNKDIFRVFISSIRFCFLFLASIFLFFVARHFFKMNPKFKSVIFMNVQLKKLNIPPELLADLNVIVNKKRLTKSKALRIIRSAILPLHRR